MSTKTRTGRPAEEQEFEPDWEEIEQNLADYPDLLEYEKKIRRKAALQRMLRFASEQNWEAFQQELSGPPGSSRPRARH